MTAKGKAIILCLGLLAFLSAKAAAEEPLYLGHISLADIRNDGKDVMIFRENAVSGEPALLNMPLGPGDTVRTSDVRRTEIQFDNGTIIRLDTDTELKIETILAPSLSSLANVSNVVLARGRAYIMYTEYDRRELFQILTPGAALKMKNHTVAEVEAVPEGATAVRVSNGRVDVLFGPAAKKVDGEKVRSGESLIVTADGRLEKSAPPAAAEFQAWNAALNEDFEKTHDGVTPLPKPIQKMPKAVFYFAQRYSTTYGEWIWDEYLGYVWRPNANDHRYPWGSWSPYYAGQWATRDGRMFWVPQEPWGWVPFHLGVWQWDKKRGWLWIPGSAFAPAWVTWSFYAGSACWRPWMLWDWYFGELGFFNWWGNMGFWGLWYDGWPGAWYYPGFYYPYYVGPDPNPEPSEAVVTKVSKDQLKGKAPKVMPVPKDMQGAYKGFLTALRRGDPNVVESLLHMRRDVPSSPVERLRFETPTRPVPARLGFDRDAALIVLRDAGVVDGPKPRSRGRESAPVSFRFRDWNPDVKLAVRQGISIRYDSRTNQVLCPQRGLSSDVIVFRGRGYQGSDGFVSSGSSSLSSDGSTVSTSSGAHAPSGHAVPSAGHAASGGTKKD
jgi:hypothetical protein